MEVRKILLTIILTMGFIWNRGVIVSANVQYIWDYIANACSNEYGTAGLLGNIQAESGIIPYRLQDDFSSGYAKSLEYTEKVDNGIISRDTFIHDEKGYGLAQWTWWSRKRDYYDWCQNRGGSIGDTDNACSYLVHELQTSYPSVWAVMQSATDIKSVSDKVLHDFENPTKQDEKVENYRYDLSVAVYETYGTGVIPPPPIPPAPEPTPPTDYRRIIILFGGDEEND